MKKVVCPVVCRTGNRESRAFAEITFENGKLSIHGVIGPMHNGGCCGSAGQCVDGIRAGDPVAPWTREMVDKFCDIWNAWHLNDMRPYCEHQKALGWDEIAKRKVTIYHYRLTKDALRKLRAAENAAIAALKKGETFTTTAEQVKFATLPYSITTATEISKQDAEVYEPKKPLFVGDSGATEQKALGRLREDEHPDGLLCKPCPACGYKYGTSWKKEEIPQEVIDFLTSLPDSEVKPAWV